MMSQINHPHSNLSNNLTIYGAWTHNIKFISITKSKKPLQDLPSSVKIVLDFKEL